MAIQIQTGADTAGRANVSSDFQLEVTTNQDPTKTGFVRVVNESDPGDVTGTALLRQSECDADYRTRVGIDTLMDSETFCYSVQNTGKHFYATTTMTMALAGGFLVTNSANITTLNTGTVLRTWKYFPLYGQQTPLSVEIAAKFTAAVATNTTINYGIFIPGAANPYTPADGVYFKATSSGVAGIINYNSIETSTGVLTFSIVPDQVYQFLIVVTDRQVEFWIDDVLYGTLSVQTGNGQPMMGQSAPVAIRHVIGGTAAGTAMSFRVADYSVFIGSLHTSRPWGVQMAGAGFANQVQSGATAGGQLTTYANGAAPAASTLTASTAPAINSLGGLYLISGAVTAGESDYPMFAYQVPVGTSAVPGKSLVVTGIRIGEAFVTTVLVGGPLMFQWGIGGGATASSLATAESASFGATTTKSPRRIPIGTQSIGAAAAVGTLAAGFDLDFSASPLVVDPGQYLHVILRAIGTNLTSGAIRGTVAVMGYFE